MSSDTIDLEDGSGGTAWDRIFATNLQAARDHVGLSQYELAHRASRRGARFYQTTVARIESGQRAVKLGEAKLLAELLNRSLDDMLTPVTREEASDGLRKATSGQTLVEFKRTATRLVEDTTTAIERAVFWLDLYCSRVAEASKVPDKVIVTETNMFVVECKVRRSAFATQIGKADLSYTKPTRDWDESVRDVMTKYSLPLHDRG